MNEQEIRRALNGVLVASSPPPPMDPERALRHARQARTRRRTTMAGIGAALAVVVVAFGMVTFTPMLPDELSFGGDPSRGAGDTETVWPTGPDGSPQSDRTAHAGPRHEQGVRLLDELIASVPDGLTVPEPVVASDPSSTEMPTEFQPERSHQANFADEVNGTEVWDYMAMLSVMDGDRTGLVFAEVHTPRNGLPDDLCDAAARLWSAGTAAPGADWRCDLRDVGGDQVGVVSSFRGGHPPFDQWAVYRHADDTVVYIAQSKAPYVPYGPEPSPLLEQPFSLDRLAELAADPRFRLG